MSTVPSKFIVVFLMFCFLSLFVSVGLNRTVGVHLIFVSYMVELIVTA